MGGTQGGWIPVRNTAVMSETDSGTDGTLSHPSSQILQQNLKHDNLGESLPGKIFTWKTFTRLFGGQMTTFSLTLMLPPSVLPQSNVHKISVKTTKLIDTLAIRFNSGVVKLFCVCKLPIMLFRHSV
jgi:hypothetical protein